MTLCEDEYKALISATTALREAQNNYMEDRGNEELGALVKDAAEVVDLVLEEISK